MHGHGARDGFNLGDECGDVVRQVGLIENDDRHRPAVPRRREVALDTARVEVALEAAHKKQSVDVGGDDLLVGVRAGDFAREFTEPRQYRLDCCLAFVMARLNCDPVADGRKIGACARLVTELAGHLGGTIILWAEPKIKLSVSPPDAGGLKAASLNGSKLNSKWGFHPKSERFMV